MELNRHRTGTGEPLVLLHGIGSRWQVWNPVLDRLAAHAMSWRSTCPVLEPPRSGTPSLTKLVHAHRLRAHTEYDDPEQVARVLLAGSAPV